MPFEHDVFVSYAHIDDEVLAEGQIGWISALHRALEVRLAQLLGKEARVWRDPKLQGNDVFADRLIDGLPGVAVLVSILSPRYVKSEWCQRELNEFLKISPATGGLRVGDKIRVFKVVKTPVPRDQHPPELQQVLGYEFFTVESATGRQREMSALSGPDTQRLYWAKLDDLAHDICDLLGALESQAAPAAPSKTAAMAQDPVYLAETSFDLQDKRDVIKRELQGHGYTVLPDQPLPLVGAACAAFVREQLARCRLSVHMIGQNYGVVPDGSSESLVVLQHEQAIERGAAGAFCRLIWMPPEPKSDDERQQRFIEQLQTDQRIQTGADLVVTSIEDFKSVLHVRLSPPRPSNENPQERPHDEAGEPLRRIYLICDQRDLDQIRPLEDQLFDQGFEVTLPAFDGDETQIRRDHEENLTVCDAALIYYGAGNDLWLRGKLRELQKIAGYGRSKPMRAKAIYVAAPDTPQEQRLRTHEAIVINQLDAVAPALAASFVSQLK